MSLHERMRGQYIFLDFLIFKKQQNNKHCIQTLQFDRWRSWVWIMTPQKSVSLHFRVSYSYSKSFVILTLTPLTERPSEGIWNLNMCCLYSVPCCFTVIRSPRDTWFLQVLGSIQFGMNSWLVPINTRKNPQVIPVSSVSERPLVWVLSFLSFPFDLFLFPIILIFVVFILWA